MLILNSEGRFVSLNQMAEDVLGVSIDALGSKSFADLHWLDWSEIPPFQKEKSNPITDFIQKNESVREVQRGLLKPETKDLVWLKISACYYSVAEEEEASILVCLHDITTEVQQQMALDFRSKGQSLFLEISRSLHFLKEDKDLSPVITKLLTQAAKLFHSDRSYVYYHRALEHYLPSIYQWKREGLKPCSKESFRKIHRIMEEEHEKSERKAEQVLIEQKSADPKWNWLFEEREVKSLLLLPLLDVDGKCAGYWGLESQLETPHFNLTENRGVVFLADILGAFFDRYIKTWNLRERIKEIRCVDEITQICLENEGIDLDYLQKLVDAMPAGFLRPEETQVCILTPKQKFESKAISNPNEFFETKIQGPSGNENILRVDLGKGLAFLAEEVKLIQRIAGIIEAEWLRSYNNHQLKLNIERLSKLAESKQFYVLRVDLQGRIIAYSPKFEEDYRWYMEGNQIPSMINRSSLETIYEYHHQLTLETVQNCLEAPGKIFPVLLDKLGKNGETRHVMWEFVALVEDNGEVSEIQCMGIDVTEIQESKRKLERFKEISDSSTNASIITDTSGKIEYVNEQFCRMSGYSPEEILHRDGGLMFLDEFKETREQIAQEIEEKGLIENRELELPFKNGRTLTFLFSAKRIESPNGDWIYYSLLDISERKQQEMAIQAQKKRFEAIIRAVPDMIFVLSNEGVYQEFYPGYVNRNLDFNHLIGHQVDEAHSPEISSKIHQAIMDCQADKKVKSLQYPRKIGSEKMWFESTFAPIDNNRIIQFIRDITFRKEHEEQLQRFNIAIQQSPVGIIITDLQGFIEYASPSMQKISGYRPEQLDGMSARLFSSGQNPPEVYKELWTKIHAGLTWEGELLNRNRDGKIYWERLSISPIKRDDGTTYKYMALKQNVDTEKRNQQQLIIQKEIFREIAHSQSHEVRAPLARILGLVELLKETSDEKARQELIDKIGFSSEELDAIIRQTVEKVTEAENLYT